jgi:hypothetical protein
VPQSHTATDAHVCPAVVCVSAVLGDALARVAVLGGRDGMPRSLGSVYGGSVTRFLGSGLRGVVSRVRCGVVGQRRGGEPRRLHAAGV